jgi:hypothetical protein
MRKRNLLSACVALAAAALLAAPALRTRACPILGPLRSRPTS